MQALFEREKRSSVDAQEALERNLREVATTEGEGDAAFARALLEGILTCEQELKEVVQRHAPGWTLERMDPISRCALQIGAYELLYGIDAVAAGGLNNTIEITKEYGTEESGKFVNGVLNAIAHRA